MAVIVGDRCHIGRLLDRFGSYSPENGLDAELWLRTPDGEGAIHQFHVDGKRTAISVGTSISQVER